MVVMKFTNNVLSIVSLLILYEQTNCLKILTVVPVRIKSHWLIGSAIAKTLATVGHEVTIINSFKLQNPPEHYKDIDIGGLVEFVPGKGFKQISPPKFMYSMYARGLNITPYVFTNPKIIKLMNDKNVKFDLVIVELFGTPTFIGLGEYFNAPVIGFVSSRSTKWTNAVSGNTAPLSYVPQLFADSKSRMTFKQRFTNMLWASFESFIDLIFYQSQKQFYEKYFPNAKLSYTEMISKGVSLVLLNTHFSFHPIAPFLPNTIDIGGFHVERDIKPLSEDLRQFIDSAEHGVIYFALGSFIPSSYISFEDRQALMKAFSQLKQKVIWKSEKFDGETLPDNVLMQKWCAQNDILAHPNVKLFITHGGTSSLIEAIYHGKPIIGIPFYGDQKGNIAVSEERGFAYRLNSNQLTFGLISKALNTVLYNQSYAENIRKMSKIYHDQPMTPKEKLIYWVEYVARHKGAPHLKSPRQELNFIQYHMIDVFGLIFVVALFVVLSILICIKLTFKRIFLKKIKIA